MGTDADVIGISHSKSGLHSPYQTLKKIQTHQHILECQYITKIYSEMLKLQVGRNYNANRHMFATLIVLIPCSSMKTVSQIQLQNFS